MKQIGIYELEPSDRFINIIGGIICRDESPFQSVCKSYLELHFSLDEELNTLFTIKYNFNL